jgi:hypothetical protein
MTRIPILLAAILAACSPLQTSRACDGAQPAHCPGLADVQVLDRSSGQVMPIYRHNGELWVAGTPGHNYAVRLHNSSPGRILTVVAVDGVNAVSGDTAGWNQAGYVLSSWESYDVVGWRKSQERVADFVFTALEDSYAARTGRPLNVGVIGVAVFREKVAEPQAPLGLYAPESRRNESRLLQDPSATRGAVRSPLGTGHGSSEYSFVGTTTFERAHPEPDLVVSIRYDRPETLVAMGIIPGPARPRPFPESAALGFVPDPPWRR